MMKKKKITDENFLLRIPLRKEGLNWSVDEKGIVTLEIENKGFYNRLFQKLLKKPKITYIHLDETGSFIWPLFSENKDIVALGKDVSEKFGDKAEPLYERLSEYIKRLAGYGFITYK